MSELTLCIQDESLPFIWYLVFTDFVLRFILAPFFTNRARFSTSPCSAAKNAGVIPRLSAQSMQLKWRSSSSNTSVLLIVAAWCSNVLLPESDELTTCEGNLRNSLTYASLQPPQAMCCAKVRIYFDSATLPPSPISRR